MRLASVCHPHTCLLSLQASWSSWAFWSPHGESIDTCYSSKQVKGCSCDRQVYLLKRHSL